LRIGIFSDVHGNLEALESVISAIKQESLDAIFCLGDLVGYGPEPNVCIRLVRELTPHVVVGNHDHAAIGRLRTDYFNTYAKEAMVWTIQHIDSDSIHYLESLPLIMTEGQVTLVHATPGNPDQWDYIFTLVDAWRHFDHFSTPICFVGHSHIPVAFMKNKSGNLSMLNPANVTIDKKCQYIINVGSTGQPRDNDPRAAYGVLDLNKGIFQLKRVSYPVEIVQKKMEKEGLPRYLINRLASGQ
jgi:predicted phosphodiesterase